MKRLRNSPTWILIVALLAVTGCRSIPTRQAISMMNNPTFPDQRREGINALVAQKIGRQLPYTADYIKIATDDPDYTVRAIAIRALNRSRDTAATKVFVNGLSDAHALVRLEAAKALNRVPDADAISPLIAHLQAAYPTGAMDDRGIPIQQDETVDVRIASAQALRHYKAFNVARALIDVLNAREFAIAWQARRSLRQITGKDYGYNQTAWLNYLSSPDQPLQ